MEEEKKQTVIDPLADRPGGRLLSKRLRDGDHLAVAGLRAIVDPGLTVLAALDEWTRKNVTLHVVDADESGVEISGREAEELIRVLQEIVDAFAPAHAPFS